MQEPFMKWIGRPLMEIAFIILSVGVYLVLPLLNHPVSDVPGDVWLAYGAVLGVARWGRAKMQENANPAPAEGE